MTTWQGRHLADSQRTMPGVKPSVMCWAMTMGTGRSLGSRESTSASAGGPPVEAARPEDVHAGALRGQAAEPRRGRMRREMTGTSAIRQIDSASSRPQLAQLLARGDVRLADELQRPGAHRLEAQVRAALVRHGADDQDARGRIGHDGGDGRRAVQARQQQVHGDDVRAQQARQRHRAVAVSGPPDDLDARAPRTGASPSASTMVGESSTTSTRMGRFVLMRALPFGS